MLPKLKLRHQSIMHDYMFGSARKAQVIKAKTFKWFFYVNFFWTILIFRFKSWTGILNFRMEKNI